MKKQKVKKGKKPAKRSLRLEHLGMWNMAALKGRGSVFEGTSLQTGDARIHTHLLTGWLASVDSRCLLLTHRNNGQNQSLRVFVKKLFSLSLFLVSLFLSGWSGRTKSTTQAAESVLLLMLWLWCRRTAKQSAGWKRMAARFWRVGNCGLVPTGRSGFSSSRSRGADLWEHPERQLVATCWQPSLIFCTWQGSPGSPDVCKWVTSKSTRSTSPPPLSQSLYFTWRNYISQSALPVST